MFLTEDLKNEDILQNFDDLMLQENLLEDGEEGLEGSLIAGTRLHVSVPKGGA